MNPDGRNERDIVTELYYRGHDPRVEKDEEHFDGRDETGPQVREMPEPKGASQADMAKHRLTHLPFAPWCTTCIRARGRDGPHKTTDPTHDERQELSRIEADYFFLGSSQGDDDETQTCLALYDTRTGTTWSSMVPHKGGGDAYSIRLAVAFLDGLGIQEGILRTDGEPSILDWAKQVKKAWKGKLVLEASARGSAESKGGVERSIQTIQGMVRTLKLDLEERLGTTLETTTPVLAWLVRHAGWLLTRYQRHGRLGATSFQVLRGVPYEGQLVRFGEVVVYRYPFGLAGDGHGRHKLDPRWGVGVWLGRTESSNEHVVGTERGVERVRVVRRRPVGQQDDADQGKENEGVSVGAPHHATSTRSTRFATTNPKEEEEGQGPKGKETFQGQIWTCGSDGNSRARSSRGWGC